MIRRWHYLTGGPQPATEPFVCSARMLDIPNTLVGAINNLRANCVAICIRAAVGLTLQDLHKIERAARRKGLRVFWVARRAALRAAP